jgi:hypothetical protein
MAHIQTIKHNGPPMKKPMPVKISINPITYRMICMIPWTTLPTKNEPIPGKKILMIMAAVFIAQSCLDKKIPQQTDHITGSS